MAAPESSTGLRKPVYIKVDKLDPQSRGVNLILKVIAFEMKSEFVKKLTGQTTRFGEAKAGDDTGAVTLFLKNEQIDVCKPGKTIIVRNGCVRMQKEHIQLEVDRWGKLLPSEQDAEFEVNSNNDISAVEYELVSVTVPHHNDR